ncbi:MAG TPA: Crp/Fnr family transcriptional regulator [Chitinophagaceae bacterium]|nr:Crp/Fnr family transcriptional regulator [Chitinophagaceae bacterium]
MSDRTKKRLPFLEDTSHPHSKFYHRKEVPAGTVLIREGEIAKKAFLIEKGCIRAWVNNNGRDITFQFFFENEAVSSSESFRKNIPSLFTIETVEPCILHWIYKKDLETVVEDVSKLPNLKSKAIISVFERQYQYMRQLISFVIDTPEQRYLKLLLEKPHIIRRVPLQYIATYLGVTPVSLSRIRKRVSTM